MSTPRTDTDPTPARKLRDAIEPIAMVHVHSAEAREAYEALGLERFAGYVLGRAGTLGEPPTPVVVASFGAFSPAMLGGVYEQARATASVADVLAARVRTASRALHRAAGDPGPEVDETVGVLRSGLERAEPLGKPLFAGHTALPWPEDPWGRLWHAANLLRELRGDAHVDALVAAAIGPLASNLLTEAHVGLDTRDYTRTRGWGEDEVDAAVADLVDRRILGEDGALTDRGRRLRDDVEDATEAALDEVVVGIGPALDTVVERCRAWSDAVIAADAFPDDAFKRAAG